MKKKGFLIVIPVIAVIGIMFFLGIKRYNESFSNFQYDGYVIDNTTNTTSSSYYFNKDAKYKVVPQKNVVSFDNSDNVEVSISDDSFLHFNDGSISVFKKSVVLNLEELNEPVLHYYNIYNGSIFTKVGNGYQINYLNQKLNFSNFMIKVSDNKYMIVGNDITIEHGDKTERVTDGYVEFIYLDGNIVRIKNQNLEIQNISDDLTIKSGNSKLDLESKKVFLDDTLKLNLGEMTIDSDDNIDIVPDDVNTTIDNPDLIDPNTGKAINPNGGVNGGSGGSGNGGSGGGSGSKEEKEKNVYTPNVNISGLRDGVINTSIDRQEEIVLDNVTVPDPTFELKDFFPTQYGVSAKVTITMPDSNAVEIPPDSSIVISIVDIKKNQVVYTKSVSGSEHYIEVLDAVDVLNAATNYAFIVHASYNKNGVGYEKDFIQRTFMTDSLGLYLEKVYVKPDEFSIAVKKETGSGVTSYKYRLLDENGGEIDGVQESNERNIANISTDELKFDTRIEPNKKYRVKITEITNSKSGTLHETDMKSPIYLDITTLKRDPTFKSTSYVQTTNKQSGKFSFHLKDVTDPDNAVQEYRVDLYNVATGELVASRSSSVTGTIDMFVEGKDSNDPNAIITRGVVYVANIVVVVNDNEKVKEYEIGRTNNITLSGLVGPVASLNIPTINFESAEGTLIIQDENETLDPNSSITIVIEGSEAGGADAQTQIYELSSYAPDMDRKRTIGVHFFDLKQDTYYRVSVYGVVDYRETNQANYRTVCLATFNFNTKAAISFKANWLPTSTNGNSNFSQYIALSPGSFGTPTWEAGTFTGLYLRFYNVDSYNREAPCNENNSCFQALLEDTRLTENWVSSLSERLYNPNGVENVSGNINKILITEDTFLNDPKYGGANKNLKNYIKWGKFYLELYEAYDYTHFKNVIPIEDNVSEVAVNSNNNDDPLNGTEVTPILATPSSTYDGNTIIGYKVCPMVDSGIINSITSVDVSIYHDGESYALTDLFTDSQIESMMDNNKCLRIMFEDFENKPAARELLHYYRGGYFNFTLKVHYLKSDNTEGVSEESITDVQNPPKQLPFAYAYLSKRDDNRLIFGYDIVDIDESIVKEEMTLGDEVVKINPAYYKLGGVEKKLVCAPQGSVDYSSTDCLHFDNSGRATGYFATGPGDFTYSSKGSPLVYIKVKQREYELDNTTAGAVDNYNLFEGWYFDSVTKNLSGIASNTPMYSLYHVTNRNYFNVLLISAENNLFWFKDETVVYKLTFSGKIGNQPPETVVLYKTKNDIENISIGGTTYQGFKINHSDVASLISSPGAENEKVITLKMELLYNTEYVGFDNSSDNGYAIQLMTNNVSQYYYSTNGFYYDIEQFTFGGSLRFKPYNANASNISSITWNTTKSRRGVSYGSSDVMVKVLGNHTLEANTGCRADTTIGSTCSYSFLGDSPSFELPQSNIVGGINGFTVKPIISSRTSVDVYMYVERLRDGVYYNVIDNCSMGDFRVDCAYMTYSSDSSEILSVDNLGHSVEQYRVIFRYRFHNDTVIHDFDYLDYDFGSSTYAGWYDSNHLFGYYIVRTVDNPEVTALRVKYDFGDEVSNDEYDRYLKGTFNLGYVKGYDGIRFEVYKKDSSITSYLDDSGNPVDGVVAIKTVNKPINELRETNNEVFIDVTPQYRGHIEENPTPDSTMTTENDYVVYAYPYYLDNEQQVVLSYASVQSADVEEFILPRPFINVKLEENASTSLVNFYVTISDQKGSLGGYRAAYSSSPTLVDEWNTYREREAEAGRRYYINVYYIRDGVETTIRTKVPVVSPQFGIRFNDIECSAGDSCSVRVEWYSDLNNDGVYEVDSDITSFTLTDGLSYSRVSASGVSGNKKLRVLFIDLYGSHHAKYVVASLYVYNSNGQLSLYKNLPMRNVSFSPTTGGKYFDLDFITKIPNGSYVLQFQLYGEGNVSVGSDTVYLQIS